MKLLLYFLFLSLKGKKRKATAVLNGTPVHEKSLVEARKQYYSSFLHLKKTIEAWLAVLHGSTCNFVAYLCFFFFICCSSRYYYSIWDIFFISVIFCCQHDAIRLARCRFSNVVACSISQMPRLKHPNWLFLRVSSIL